MRSVDAGEALQELTRLSADIERVAVIDSSGAVRASTAGDGADRLARVAAELQDIAAPVRRDWTVAKIEVSMARGSVFVVRSHGLIAIATTRPEPVSALVAHDLLTCLERVDASLATKGRRRRQTDPVDA